jgi:hypothetical protein
MPDDDLLLRQLTRVDYVVRLACRTAFRLGLTGYALAELVDGRLPGADLVRLLM